MTHQSAAVPTAVGDCRMFAPTRAYHPVSVCDPHLRDSSFPSLANKSGSTSHAGD